MLTLVAPSGESLALAPRHLLPDTVSFMHPAAPASLVRGSTAPMPAIITATPLHGDTVELRAQFQFNGVPYDHTWESTHDELGDDDAEHLLFDDDADTELVVRFRNDGGSYVADYVRIDQSLPAVGAAHPQLLIDAERHAAARSSFSAEMIGAIRAAAAAAGRAVRSGFRRAGSGAKRFGAKAKKAGAKSKAGAKRAGARAKGKLSNAGRSARLKGGRAKRALGRKSRAVRDRVSRSKRKFTDKAKTQIAKQKGKNRARQDRSKAKKDAKAKRQAEARTKAKADRASGKTKPKQTKEQRDAKEKKAADKKAAKAQPKQKKQAKPKKDKAAAAPKAAATGGPGAAGGGLPGAGMPAGDAGDGAQPQQAAPQDASTFGITNDYGVGGGGMFNGFPVDPYENDAPPRGPFTRVVYAPAGVRPLEPTEEVYAPVDEQEEEEEAAGDEEEDTGVQEVNGEYELMTADESDDSYADDSESDWNSTDSESDFGSDDDDEDDDDEFEVDGLGQHVCMHAASMASIAPLHVQPYLKHIVSAIAASECADEPAVYAADLAAAMLAAV